MDDEWATRGAPDAQSAGYAAHVLDGLRSRGMSPASYLKRHDGLSQGQAETLVATCQDRRYEYFSEKFRMLFPWWFN
jgi:hypothetical protein